MSTNLLLVSPYSMSFYGGVQNQLGLIKKYLPEDDFNVKYLCPDSPDFNLGKSMKISFNGAIAPIKLFVNKSTLREATKWADIVHLHEPFIPMFFWRLPINKKTIITHHASLSKVIGLIQKMFIKSEIYAYTVTAVSAEASKNTLNKVKVKIIPNAIERKDARSSFNPAKEFLFVGRDEKRKNFKLYVRLSKKLNNDEYTYRAITNKKKNLSNITLYVNPNDKEKEDAKLKPHNRTDPNILLVQRKLEELLGLDVKVINKKNNSGKVIIQYSNVDQFEMLASLLRKKKQ